MSKLNFTQRRGGMMATILVPVNLTAAEVEDFKKLAEAEGYKRAEWRKMLAYAASDGVTNALVNAREDGEI